MFSPRVFFCKQFFCSWWGVSCIFIIVIVLGVTYVATPKTWRVGYAPEQPISFSHKLHVKELGLDCRSCHTRITEGPVAGTPDAQSCLSCHQTILPESRALEPLHRAVNKKSPFYTGEPLTWTKVHVLPDYAVFNHAAHTNRGIGCTSCHGEVAEMERVFVVKSLSMSWCLECHRNPAPEIRPLEDVVLSNYSSEKACEMYNQRHPGAEIGSPKKLSLHLMQQWKIKPRTDCAACHH